MVNSILEAVQELNNIEDIDYSNIIAYHGSAVKFSKFDISKVNTGHNDGGMFGPGLYFTESKDLAKIWNDSGYLYRVKLSFDHPYICRNDEDRKKLYDLIHSKTIDADSSKEEFTGRNINDMTDFFKRGYDSVISLNEEWKSDTSVQYHNQYVAFKNNQIKILGIEKYHNEDNLNESYNLLKHYQQTILKILKIRFNSSTTPQERSFLLPDGSFIAMDVDEYRSENSGKTQYTPHYTADNFIGNFIYDYLHKSYNEYSWDSPEEKAEKLAKYNITEFDIKEMYDGIDWDKVGGEYGCPILEDMGCIRLNGGDEYYLVIPERHSVSNLSSLQYSSLESWLKKFVEFNSKKFTVTVADSDWELAADFEEYDSNDIGYIINRIRRYYISGKLFESKIDKKL